MFNQGSFQPITTSICNRLLKETFPKELREVQTEQEIQSVLLNKKVRDAFLSWINFNVNKSFASEHSRIKKIYKLLTGAQDQTILNSLFANTIIWKSLSNEFYKLCESGKKQYLTTYSISDKFKLALFNEDLYIVSLIKNCLDTGQLNFLQIAPFFYIQTATGETILHHPDVAKILFPSILVDDPNERDSFGVVIFKMLSIKNNQGKTSLHHQEILCYAAKLINENLSSDMQLRLLNIQDNQGIVPFHNPSYLKLMLSRIEKYPPKSLFNCLRIVDQYGLNVFHKERTFYSAFLLLQSLPIEDQMVLLSFTGINGMLPLQNPYNFKKSIKILKTLNPDTQAAFLIIPDDMGRNVFHYPESAEKYLEVFFRLPIHQQVFVLSSRDKVGSPLFDNKIAKLFFDFRNKIKEEDFLQNNYNFDFPKIFSIQDEYGYTPIHYNKIFREIFPSLMLLDLNELYALCAIPNAMGKTPLHESSEILENILGYQNFIYNSTPQDQRSALLTQQVKVVSVQDGFGLSPLHYRSGFKP